MKPNKLENFINSMNELFPESENGAVVFHMDKEGNLKSISPLCRYNGNQDMFEKLLQVKDGLQNFLNDMLNKGLAKNGQTN